MSRNAAPWFVSFVLAASGLGSIPGLASPPAETPAADNAEVAALFQADQADRKPPGGAPIDWSVVAPRDRARESRVTALLADGGLRTGKDHFRAAVILQHGPTVDSHLLAHELAIVALAKGEAYAKWLVAATEDRILTGLGRRQRFGTQYRSDGPGLPMRLEEVDPNVPDGLRREFDVPPLEKARQHEVTMNPTPTP